MGVVRGIGAVLAGCFVILTANAFAGTVLSNGELYPTLGTEMRATHTYVLALLCYVVGALVAGFLATKLAPGVSRWPLVTVAVVAFALGMVNVWVRWGLPAPWYSLAIALTAIPLVWIGSWLAARI